MRGADAPRPDLRPPRAAPLVESARIDPGGEHGRGPWLVILGAVVLVTLAVLKPWQEPVSRPIPTFPGGVGAAATPAPTPDARPSSRSADEVAAARCNRPTGWRTYAFERWHDQTIRSWIVVTPLEAALVGSALDPRIPVVPVIGEEITALGYCASIVEGERPPARVTVEVWAVDPSGTRHALEVQRIEPRLPSSLSALYAYPDPSGWPGRASWPPGRYLFAIRGEPGSGWGRWWAVEVVEFRPD